MGVAILSRFTIAFCNFLQVFIILAIKQVPSDLYLQFGFILPRQLLTRCVSTDRSIKIIYFVFSFFFFFYWSAQLLENRPTKLDLNRQHTAATAINSVLQKSETNIFEERNSLKKKIRKQFLGEADKIEKKTEIFFFFFFIIHLRGWNDRADRTNFGKGNAIFVIVRLTGEVNFPKTRITRDGEKEEKKKKRKIRLESIFSMRTGIYKTGNIPR